MSTPEFKERLRSICWSFWLGGLGGVGIGRLGVRPRCLGMSLLCRLQDGVMQ